MFCMVSDWCDLATTNITVLFSLFSQQTVALLLFLWDLTGGCERDDREFPSDAELYRLAACDNCPSVDSCICPRWTIRIPQIQKLFSQLGIILLVCSALFHVPVCCEWHQRRRRWGGDRVGQRARADLSMPMQYNTSETEISLWGSATTPKHE